MPTRWEYKAEELRPNAGALVQHLNDEDGEGWEFVTVAEVDGDDGRSVQHLVFRRELTNPTWEQ